MKGDKWCYKLLTHFNNVHYYIHYPEKSIVSCRLLLIFIFNSFSFILNGQI